MEAYIYKLEKMITKKQRKQGMRQFDAGGCYCQSDICLYAAIMLLDLLSRGQHSLSDYWNLN